MELLRKRSANAAQSLEKQSLIADIRKAELEWKNAEWRFQYAVGDDHVDYAIYCLEAAEKKLAMLLKQAKGKGKDAAELKEAGGAK